MNEACSIIGVGALKKSSCWIMESAFRLENHHIPCNHHFSIVNFVSLFGLQSPLPAYDAHGRARGLVESDEVLFAERDKAGGRVGRAAAYHMVNDADAQDAPRFDQAAGDVAILLAGCRVA
jgi:hypothetical protein